MNDINYFLPGQLWQYNTRNGEEASTLTVLKIDELENDAIIHIRIDELGIGGQRGFLAHLPFSADAMMASVTGFIKHLDAVPDFKEGYDQWKQSFEDGKADYWKVAVKEAVEVIEQIMNKKH